MATRILVIDDEIDICEMIEEIVGEVADEVICVQSAGAALKVLDQQEIHLVISDINMPEMSGIELLKVLHKKMYGHPVVFVSASDDDEVLSKALEYGAADFIAKPFEADEVLILVRKLIAVTNILDTGKEKKIS